MYGQSAGSQSENLSFSSIYIFSTQSPYNNCNVEPRITNTILCYAKIVLENKIKGFYRYYIRRQFQFSMLEKHSYAFISPA